MDPTLVEVPAPRAETTVPDATVVFPLIPMMLAPLDEIVMPGPAERVIVPVEEPPGAEMAFRPLTDTVMELTPVAVCRLMLAPAARAKDRRLPTMLVPEALMVLVPPPPPPPPA